MPKINHQPFVILPHGANGPAVDIITTKVKTLIRELELG